jgi:hypothetical protein
MPVDADCGLYAGVRYAVEERLSEEGRWSDALAPLADEYVAAAQLAARFRATAHRRPFHTSKETGRTFAHPAHAAADRKSRLVLRLAAALGLTKLRAAGAQDPDPFAAVDEGRVS